MSRSLFSAALGVAVLVAVSLTSALAGDAAVRADAGKCRICGGDVQNVKKCQACGGSGECPACQGKGSRYSAFSKSLLKCIPCKYSGKCRACGGSGVVGASVCANCTGAGKPREKPPVDSEDATPPQDSPPLPSRNHDAPQPDAPPLGPAAPEEPAPQDFRVDQSGAAAAVSEYTSRIAALKTLQAEGKTQDAAFRDVLGNTDRYKDRVLRSDVLLLAGHPRQVRVAGDSQSARLGGSTMSPISMVVGKKAQKLAMDAGESPKVVVTYGVLSSDQFILLDICEPK